MDHPLLTLLILSLAAVPLVTFLLFGADKSCAKRGMWRIPEETLLAFCGVGGAIGGLAGMYFFRHKTKHRKFTRTVPAILAIQIVAVAGLISLAPGSAA